MMKHDIHIEQIIYLAVQLILYNEMSPNHLWHFIAVDTRSLLLHRHLPDLSLQNRYSYGSVVWMLLYQC